MSFPYYAPVSNLAQALPQQQSVNPNLFQAFGAAPVDSFPQGGGTQGGGMPIWMNPNAMGLRQQLAGLIAARQAQGRMGMMGGQLNFQGLGGGMPAGAVPLMSTGLQAPPQIGQAPMGGQGQLRRRQRRMMRQQAGQYGGQGFAPVGNSMAPMAGGLAGLMGGY